MNAEACVSGGGCCGTNESLTKEPLERLPWLSYDRLEVICRVAIGALSLSIAPAAFVLSAAGGAGVAFGLRAWHHFTGEELASTGRRPVCAQGYSEMLSGRRFAERVNLLVTAVFVATHTQHMPHFFVPFTGVYLGMWVTDTLVDAVDSGLARWQGPAATPDRYAATSTAHACCH